MKMLMECATPATLLGEAEALRHTLRVKWHFRVGEVLNREWCPELTYEEATKQDTELDKKLRSTIKVGASVHASCLQPYPTTDASRQPARSEWGVASDVCACASRRSGEVA